MALFTIISAENLVAPPPPSAARALFKYFPFKKQKNPRAFGKKYRVFPHSHEIIRYFLAVIFSLAKHICLSIQNLQKTYFAMSFWISKKRLKIDHFERGMSEQFPIAYDEIHMKLLNLELFISKALTFS